MHYCRLLSLTYLRLKRAIVKSYEKWSISKISSLFGVEDIGYGQLNFSISRIYQDWIFE